MMNVLTFSDSNIVGETRIKYNRLQDPCFHPLLNFTNHFPQAFQRVKTLRIRSRFPPTQDFTACFDKAAPILESFALYVPSYGTTHYTFTPLQLPSPLFGGCTPNLRKLSLDGAEVPWTSPIFKNLTFLRISKDTDTPERNRVDLDMLVKIIRGCPDLVSLELEFAGPVWPAGYRNATGAGAFVSLGPKVEVRSLRNLLLHGMTEMALVKAFCSSLQTAKLQSLRVGHFGLSISDIDEFLPQTLLFDPRSNLCNCIKLDVNSNCEWVDAEQYLVDDLESRMVQNPKFFSLRWLRETNSSFERRIRCISDDDGILEVRGRDPDEYRSLH